MILSAGAPLVFLIALLVLNQLVEQLIGLLGRREVRRWAAAPPPELAGVVDEEAYRKSIPYSLAKSRYAQWTGLFDMLLLAVALAFGILPALFALLEHALPAGHPALLGACFFTVLILLTRVIDLPFAWYGTFRLEARFGFNKSTPGLWVGDQIKGLLLGLLLVFGLSFGLLALVGALPGTWWLWGFLAFTLFQALMLVLYPRLIMPLFNKFTPLPEGELRARLFALAERAGFGVSGIFVMDGSKRSAHANAFFTGFGRLRRIVLFDTLVNTHPVEELEAILAHEIGHFRLRHVLWGLVRSVVFSLVGFYALFHLSQ
jgi:STE24 endopeptidase